MHFAGLDAKKVPLSLCFTLISGSQITLLYLFFCVCWQIEIQIWISWVELISGIQSLEPWTILISGHKYGKVTEEHHRPNWRFQASKTKYMTIVTHNIDISTKTIISKKILSFPPRQLLAKCDNISRSSDGRFSRWTNKPDSKLPTVFSIPLCLYNTTI